MSRNTTSNGYYDKSQDPNLDHSHCDNVCHAIDWPAVKQARQVLRDSTPCDCSDRPGRHTRGQCDNT